LVFFKGAWGVDLLGNFVKIFVVENTFEADLVSQALQEEGIPVMLKRFSDTAYDGLYIPQKGWAAVMIPEEFKTMGERVVGEFEEAFRKRREMDDKTGK
jgi:ketol-acid reductoisomerase